MRYVTGVTLLFYVLASALQIAKEGSMTHTTYVSCVSALYFCIYAQIAYAGYNNVREVEVNVTLLERNGVPQGFIKVRRARREPGSTGRACCRGVLPPHE